MFFSPEFTVQGAVSMVRNISYIYSFSAQSKADTYDPDILEKFIKHLEEHGCSKQKALQALQSDEVSGPEDMEAGKFSILIDSVLINEMRYAVFGASVTQQEIFVGHQ